MQFHRLVQDVIELYEPMAAEKHITIVTDVHPTTTLGDKDLLFQAVTNLIDNAVKYTPEGGNITVQVEPFDTGSRLVIRDSGRGVPDEHKPYIFRRFYRVDASRSTPGTGLGLALVGAIVKLHQGHIFVADNEPTGLSVTVTI